MMSEKGHSSKVGRGKTKPTSMERVVCSIKNETTEKLDLIQGHDYVMVGSDIKHKRYFLRYWQLNANGLADVSTIPLWPEDALALAIAVFDNTKGATVKMTTPGVKQEKQRGTCNWCSADFEIVQSDAHDKQKYCSRLHELQDTDGESGVS